MTSPDAPDASLLALDPDAPPWRRALAARLRAGADAAGAATRAANLLERVGESEWRPVADERPDAFARVVATVCATAPFLATHVARHAGWLAALAREDASRALTAVEVRARVDARIDADSELPVSARLRRAKYYELARITARDAFDDVLPLARSGETLDEISALADALLARAERAASEEVATRLGPPVWRDGRGDAHGLGFCVLGLGKLGSAELNYSSDVDLVYVHAATPDDVAEDGPSGRSPLEYFTRVAQAFGRLVTEATVDGFLYRVDLDLRPEGAQGVLVVSSTALASYYEAWADTWEKAAFMKARPVAGDLALGWRAIRTVAPSIYRSTMDYEGVRAIRSLKDRVEAAHANERDGFDVKLGAGGIRDVEFVAQSMQLLHGGRMPQLRERSTRRTLEQLASLGLLDAASQAALARAYLFLRRVENRLQMVAEQQTHRVPMRDEARLRIARALRARDESDADALAAFDADLAAERERTRAIFRDVLPEGSRERVLELFERAAPGLLAFPTTRRMLEELAAHLGGELDASASPERALGNCDRFFRSVGANRFYYDLLLDRPELVDRLVALFAASNYLSGLFAAHPRLVEPVFDDPNVLLLDRERLEADHAALHAEFTRGDDDVEGALDALRRFQARQVINVGLLDVSGAIDGAAVEHALTDVAEVCAQRALEIANAQLAARRARLAAGASLRFLVVGMGKLGTRELSYGSDLDVIFLYDAEGASEADRLEAGDHCARLAQKWMGTLQTRTAEGSCYEIDARLRPSGNQGVLVTSMDGFAAYHEGGERGAAGWERQALLRARPIAGDAGLAERFERVRTSVLTRPLPATPPGDLAELRGEIHRIRMRMEQELARETTRRRDFKTGRGGVLDVESVVQYRQLAAAARHPALCEPVPLALQLERLEALGEISASDAETLREGWRFLKDLSRALRIVENRSISDLDEEQGDLEGLALRLGYASVQREGGARRALLADYRRHTDAIRRVYTATFGDG
ncbi:MAG: hypothetical protein R3E88_04235 [Myxococcota bacterium]